jgi:nucleotide-binding universal stress UspA family protein
MRKRILVLVEGMRASREALRYARALARRVGQSLELLVVLPLDLQPDRDPDALTARGSVLAHRWLQEAGLEPLCAEYHVRAGDSWSEFCKFAATRSDGFEMVVWATQPERSGKRPGWPSGHWADRIQQELSCRVIVAQRRAQADLKT